MTLAQEDAGEQALSKGFAEAALEKLYQLEAPHLDLFLHPARVALERFLRNGAELEVTFGDQPLTTLDEVIPLDDPEA